jgi:hypothetical protein
VLTLSLALAIRIPKTRSEGEGSTRMEDAYPTSFKTVLRAEKAFLQTKFEAGGTLQRSDIVLTVHTYTLPFRWRLRSHLVLRQGCRGKRSLRDSPLMVRYYCDIKIQTILCGTKVTLPSLNFRGALATDNSAFRPDS